MTITEMEAEIRALIREYAPKGTTFRWSSARKRFGSCAYSKMHGRYYGFRIAISKPLAMNNTWEVVRKTVVHEIAHANTAGHHHDEVWRAECIRLGGDGERCYTPTKRGGDVNTLPYKYVGTCPNCGQKFFRNRRVNGYHCDRRQHLVWEINRGLPKVA